MDTKEAPETERARENMKEEEEEGNQQAEKKVGLHTRTPLARTLPMRPTWASKAP